jgi:hypothetical protein
MLIGEMWAMAHKRDFILLSMEKNYDPVTNLRLAQTQGFPAEEETDIFLMGNHYWFSLFVPIPTSMMCWKCSFRRETESPIYSPIMRQVDPRLMGMAYDEDK